MSQTQQRNRATVAFTVEAIITGYKQPLEWVAPFLLPYGSLKFYWSHVLHMCVAGKGQPISKVQYTIQV